MHTNSDFNEPQLKSIHRNKTPLLGKLAGVLCALCAFSDFLCMFMTDTYDRTAVLGGIMLAICCFLLFRLDLIYPLLAPKKDFQPGRDEIPALFYVVWMLLVLALAASMVAWVLAATPMLQRLLTLFHS